MVLSSVFLRRSSLATLRLLSGSQDQFRTNIFVGPLSRRTFGDKGSKPEPTEEGDGEDEKMDRSLFTKEVPVKMPDMGLGEGKILKWYKKEGDVVRWEDLLCDIETPQFSYGMETEDEEDAIMGKILVEAPSGAIKENELICYLLHQEKKKKGSKTTEE